MKGVLDGLLSVRAGPRPDPLPEPPGPAWRVHAPWVAILGATILAALILARRDLGLVATGAGLCAIALCALPGRIRDACLAIHLAGGVVLLSVLGGAEVSGGLALPMGLFVALSLAGGAAATYVSPTIPPLAGRLPWRFEDAYRQQALAFAACGLAASLAAVAMGPTAVVRILGAALLPLAVRSYNGQLLSPAAGRRLAALAAAGNALLLLVLAPFIGAHAAALGVLAGEIVLAVGSTLAIADRTGVKLVPKPRLAVAAGAILVLGPLAVPGGAVWLLVAMLAGGAVAGMLHGARRKG